MLQIKKMVYLWNAGVSESCVLFGAELQQPHKRSHAKRKGGLWGWGVWGRWEGGAFQSHYFQRKSSCYIIL